MAKNEGQLNTNMPISGVKPKSVPADLLFAQLVNLFIFSTRIALPPLSFQARCARKNPNVPQELRFALRGTPLERSVLLGAHAVHRVALQFFAAIQVEQVARARREKDCGAGAVPPLLHGRGSFALGRF